MNNNIIVAPVIITFHTYQNLINKKTKMLLVAKWMKVKYM